VVQKILRTLKHTEDATLQDATPNIYMLCDMALAMASALAKKQQPAKGKGSLSAGASHPGSVPLPSSFYKSLDLQTAGAMQSAALNASQTWHPPCVCVCVCVCVCMCAHIHLCLQARCLMAAQLSPPSRLQHTECNESLWTGKPDDFCYSVNNSHLQAFQLMVLARYLLGVPKPYYAVDRAQS